MMQSASQIVCNARSFLGTPFRWKGRNRFSLDCVGLIVLSYGIEDYQNYTATKITRADLQAFHKRGFTTGESIHIGSFVQLSETYVHFGIVGEYVWGGFSVIHADPKSRRVVENRLDESKVRRIWFSLPPD